MSVYHMPLFADSVQLHQTIPREPQTCANKKSVPAFVQIPNTVKQYTYPPARFPFS